MNRQRHLDYFLLPTTLLRTFLWLLSVVLVVALIVISSVHDQRLDFKANATAAINQVQKKLLINDAALSGFSSLLKTVGPNNLQQVRDFTQRMRKAYPHIYMFEALISIDPKNKAAHEQSMRQAGYPDYKLTRYVSNKNPTGKTFNSIEEVPMHFPIFFIDPFFDSLKGLMGFDMLSARNMREPLLASLASGEPVASKPYKLREGGRGYVLIKAIDTLSATGPSYQEGGLAALLLIKTDTMLASAADLIPAATSRLMYGNERKLAAEEISPTALNMPLIVVDTLSAERRLDDLGQPFTLSFQQQAGLFLIHIQALGLIIMFMCLGYGLYYRSLLAKYRLQLQRDSVLVELGEQHTRLEVMVTKRTQELQRKSDENISLSRKLIHVQEDQFHYIARELHDEFGQTLTAIKINSHILENSETIEAVVTYAREISTHADSLYETMRDMIQRLRPEALDMFGLKIAIEQCIHAFHLPEQNIELELNIDDGVNEVAEIYSIASYRIVQELVNNAVKYACLSKLKVALSVEDQHIIIRVEDNGIGFDPLRNKLGFGFSGVDERARSLGGIFDLTTELDGGVKVCVRIPLKEDKPISVN